MLLSPAPCSHLHLPRAEARHGGVCPCLLVHVEQFGLPLGMQEEFSAMIPEGTLASESEVQASDSEMVRASEADESVQYSWAFRDFHSPLILDDSIIAD